MRQAIFTILSTTLVAWGLAAAPAFATGEAGGFCDDLESRMERSAARASLDAEPPQPLERTGDMGIAAADMPSPALPASDEILARLHRLNRIDGSPMAPFRLN